VGIRDGAAVTALIEKVMAHPEVAKIATKTDRGWDLAIPEWRTVHVALAGGHLAAGTDPAFLDRVAAGSGGDWPGSVANPALTALVEGSRHNAIWVMDMGLVGYMAFASFGKAMDTQVQAAPGENEPPFSQAWLDKKKALDEEQKSIEEARKRLETEEFASARAMFAAFGVTALAGGPGAKGLVLEGGQYFGLETIPAVAREVATRAFELEALYSRRRTEVWDRQNNLWRMQEELQQIRQNDLDVFRRQQEEEAAAKAAAEAAAPPGAEPPSGVAEPPAAPLAP
jgi:hypothetical protein